LDYTIEEFKGHVESSTIMKCSSCERPVKPRIVFFGEGLPKRFFDES
jgi:NAD-dependent SIR2 family protein deacetylase